MNKRIMTLLIFMSLLSGCSLPYKQDFDCPSIPHGYCQSLQDNYNQDVMNMESELKSKTESLDENITFNIVRKRDERGNQEKKQTSGPEPVISFRAITKNVYEKLKK